MGRVGTKYELSLNKDFDTTNTGCRKFLVFMNKNDYLVINATKKK